MTRKRWILVVVVIALIACAGVLGILLAPVPKTSDVSAADRARAEAAVDAMSHGKVVKIACISAEQVGGCSIITRKGASTSCDGWAVNFGPAHKMEVTHLLTYKC